MLLGDLGKGFAAVGGLWESIAAVVVDLRSRYPMTVRYVMLGLTKDLLKERLGFASIDSV